MSQLAAGSIGDEETSRDDSGPRGWTLTSIGDPQLVAVENGIWTGKTAPLFDCAVVRNTNFRDDGSLDLSSVAVVSIEERHVPRKRLRWGDIIIERSGGGPNQPVGRAAFFTDMDGLYCFSNFTSRLRVVTPTVLDPEFFHLYLHLFHFSGRTEALQRRTTGLRNLNWSAYLAGRLHLPPLLEQKAIVKVVRAVQRASSVRELELALERERKAALLEHLFTHGTRSEATKQTDIGEVPESWTVQALSDVAKIERGKFSHRPRNDPRFYGGTTAFVQTGDVTASGGRIRSYTQTLNEQGLSVSRVFPRGTILITIAANIGYTGILEFDSAFPDSLIGITPKDCLSNEYLNYYLTTQQPAMDRLAPRGTQKNINIEFLAPWRVPVPGLEEQCEIVSVLTACDEKIASLEQEIALREELFGALLEELMSGRLSVTPLLEGTAA